MEGDREVGLVVDCGVRSRPQAGIIRAEVGHTPYWYYVVEVGRLVAGGAELCTVVW
jgi:hypothetical protein